MFMECPSWFGNSDHAMDKENCTNPALKNPPLFRMTCLLNMGP